MLAVNQDRLPEPISRFAPGVLSDNLSLPKHRDHLLRHPHSNKAAPGADRIIVSTPIAPRGVVIWLGVGARVESSSGGLPLPIIRISASC